MSESPDMLALGLSREHLRDALTCHLRASGVKLAYGEDLREQGLTELSLEIALHQGSDRKADTPHAGIRSVPAWHVHLRPDFSDAEQLAATLAELSLLDLDGNLMNFAGRRVLTRRESSDAECIHGLSAMRRVMREQRDVRLTLGGRMGVCRGATAVIAEEAVQALEHEQPVYPRAGSGGCTRDFGETRSLIAGWARSCPMWPGRQGFTAFSRADLRNGLADEENTVLAGTAHLDQVFELMLRGLFRLAPEGIARRKRRTNVVPTPS